jgi:NAD(P)-dependent dehydrogenase (short-subunit alcohol dehydrogenase family)
MYHNQNIWIIGASSGIGKALAKELAALGANLAISARRHSELEKIQQEMSGNVLALTLDVSDAAAVAIATENVARHFSRIDAVINLAAIYQPSGFAELTPADYRKTVEINLLGSMYVAHAVLPVLRAQGKGQLVFCGSVAGYRGLPNGQPYSATKAAIINLAESLAVEEKPHGIDVRLLCPGFVETPMTATNSFDMPMMITAEAAAKYIAKGLKSRAFEIHFPKKFTLLMKLLQLLPNGVYLKIAAATNKRK